MTERRPFDPAVESVFCARCGRKLEPLGHLMATFLLCPVHGEFTIAPIVRQDTGHLADDGSEWIAGDGSWSIHFDGTQDEAMWEACREIDRRGLSGRATRTG